MLLVLSYARQQIDILYAMSAYILPLLIFCILPLVSAFFLNTNFARQAVVVLLGTFPAEIIYNIYSRFMSIPPLSSIEINLVWKIIYEASFGIVLILEAVAFWLTLRIMKEIHRQLS
jgi:hypothetical protein